MSERKNKNTKPAEKATQKQKNVLPFLAAAAAVVCAAVVFFTNGNRTPAGNIETDKKSGDSVAIAQGEALVIPTADITTDASFFPVSVDETQMEVIAVKDSKGNIRTAFNTCQVCYGSSRGYYVQSGSYLVCQNCGNRFSMDQVGIEAGGCNPWPIFDENRTSGDDEISISYDYLAEARNIFANWKGAY